MNIILKTIAVAIILYLVGFAYVVAIHVQEGPSPDLMSEHYRNVINKTHEIIKNF